MIALREITGLILAGGRAQRMGGVDKGLIPFHGRPLIESAIEALKGQTGHGIKLRHVPFAGGGPTPRQWRR